MSEYTYTLEQMTEVNTFTFHGHEYKVVCSHQNHPYHPSLWSHMDEVETRDLWWNIEPGDVVLDVGADFGSYTLTALACGAKRVYAWSPPFKLPHEALEAQTLKRSIEANGWKCELLPGDGTPYQYLGWGGQAAEVNSFGLWSRDGYMAAFDGPRPAQVFDTEEEAVSAIKDQPGHCSVFPVFELDDEMFYLGQVDWLKIDTEGCELAILKGALCTLKLRKPRILLEHHYHIDPECEAKCDALLEALGYVKQGTRPHGEVAHSLYIHPEGR